MEVKERVIDMLAINATDVRKNWSAVTDAAIRIRPQFITKTRDSLLLASIDCLKDILGQYVYNAERFRENDGSITISLVDLDIVENAPTYEKAIEAISISILEYATEFYEEYELWSKAPNRKAHIPFIMKAIVLGEPKKIEEYIICRAGKI